MADMAESCSSSSEASIFLAGSVGVAQCGAEGGTAVCCQGHLRRTRCVAHRLWQEFVLPNTTLRHELQAFTNSAGGQGKGQCYHCCLSIDGGSSQWLEEAWGEGLHHHFFTEHL